MPKIQIRPASSLTIKIPKFSEPQMRQIGDYADDLMDRRLDAAVPVNIFGQPRPPLSKRYAARKTRMGRRPVRDVQMTGATLAAKNVLGTFENETEVGALVGIKGSFEYRKALFSQNVDPWFGLTDDETKKVVARATDILNFNIARAAAK